MIATDCGTCGEDGALLVQIIPANGWTVWMGHEPDDDDDDDGPRWEGWPLACFGLRTCGHVAPLDLDCAGLVEEVGPQIDQPYLLWPTMLGRPPAEVLEARAIIYREMWKDRDDDGPG